MKSDTNVENVESAMTHTDLGLREVAWAGDAHLGVIRKSHLHPSAAQGKQTEERSKPGTES